MKRVIVAGSRTINNYNTIKECLDKLIEKDDVIISGHAKGVDSLVERYAKENNIKLEIIKADWDTYGKRAGYLRNLAMAEIATHLVAFWDGKSRGTKHMINIAKMKDIPSTIVRSGD